MFDLITIIQTAGLIGVFLIVFAESGLFFGFFLPGDSLLFSAGLIASGGYFNIQLLVLVCITGAIIGDTVGYWTGKKMGPKLFYKEDGLFFRKKYIRDAEIFYEKYGKYTIILARFVPFIRTFAPIVAGIGSMRYRTFISYNILGGISWVLILILSGYFLGRIIPNPDTYILPIVLGIIIISVIPVVYKYISSLYKRHS